MDRQYSRRHLVQGAGAMGLGLLAGCGRWPGQPVPATPPTIGFLSTCGTGGASTPDYEAFREGLRELGYVEGQTINVVFREAAREGLTAAAGELALLPVNLLVTVGVTATLAARETTSTVPVVQSVGGDLVDAGLAVSLAHPGGNVTGLTAILAELTGKRLEILRDALGGASRIAVLWNATHPLRARELENIQAAAGTLGLEVQSLPVRAVEDFEGALERAARERANGLIIMEDNLVHPDHRLAKLAELAIAQQLPTIYSEKSFVEVGGLMAYGPSRGASVRRAATYVDKILKGENPGALPIERPMRFDFVINLRTAQALGLTIPPHVLLQATEVIQ
jgi:putative tryptophan/tyrosine transport system substrate-binding protein